MEQQRSFFARVGFRLNEFVLLIAVVVVLLLGLILDSNQSYWYDASTNAIEIARQTSLLGIFALGSMMVIISGGIDLSAGSMIAFSGTAIACTMIFLEKGPLQGVLPNNAIVAIGIAAGLLSGFVVGTFHAWLVTSIRLPPFVATLSSLVGLRSLARVLCEYVTKTYEGARKSQVPIDQPFFNWLREPAHVWIWVCTFILLSIATWIILRWTVLGRHIYAMGGNEQAARLSGIQTDRLKWFAYVFGAMTASLAGIFYIANEGVSAPVNQGRGHELNAIAAAVVGGCSLQGGIGTVSGTILGALFLRVVIDVVAKIIKSGADIWEGLIVGIVVVLAVTFSQLQDFGSSGRRLFEGALGQAAIVVLSLLTGLIMLTTVGPITGLVLFLITLTLFELLAFLEYVKSSR